MSLICYLPGFIAAVLLLRGASASSVFLSVYLPSLLLLPDYQRATISGLPKFTWNQAALIPIILALIPKARKTWQPSFCDALVLALAASVGWSQFVNSDWDKARNLLLDFIPAAVLPYAAGKILFRDARFEKDFTGRFLAILIAVAVFSAIEFRFGFNVYTRIVQRLFPDQSSGWFVQMRWGFARVSGPYGHAIICAILFGCGLLLEDWRRRRYGGPAWRLAALAAGTLMTFSRGPWLGVVAAAGLAWAGRAKRKGRALILILVVGLGGGAGAWSAMKSYLSGDRLRAASQSQGSAMYRRELMERYVETALQRAAWGWGRKLWPVYSGMPSIDNNWLLLALDHGLIALGLFTALFTLALGTVLRAGLASPHPDRSATCFMLAGLFVLYFISITTVYLGLQARPLLFLLIGWAQAATAAASVAPSPAKPQTRIPYPAYPSFRRIIS